MVLPSATATTALTDGERDRRERQPGNHGLQCLGGPNDFAERQHTELQLRRPDDLHYNPGSETETYSYNATGDRTGAPGSIGTAASYNYDQDDELVEASVGTGPTTLGYNYDGDGLLIGRTTSTFTWDTTMSVPLLLSDGTNDYLYGPDGTPIEQADISTGSAQYYHQQAHRGPRRNQVTTVLRRSGHTS